MIKQLSTKKIYENKWLRLREDRVQFPGGQKGIYSVVETPDFALIVPFDGTHFYLVKQFRYPTGQFSWEFPAGAHEDEPDMPATEMAQRELQEETGLTAQKFQKIGYLYQADGYSTQGFHVFLATDLKMGERQLEMTEQGMEVGKFSVTEFEKMIEDGFITDAPTVSAYGLLKLKKIL